MFASGNLIFGLSTDTKPANPGTSWTFVETDTGRTYIVVSTVWTLQSPASSPATPTTNETIPAGGSIVFVRRHLLTSGKISAIGSGAIMRIL